MTTSDNSSDPAVSLPANAHSYYHAELAWRSKSLRHAYWLLFCVGIFGAHQRYLNNHARARTYLYLSGIPLSYCLAAEYMSIMGDWANHLPAIVIGVLIVFFVVWFLASAACAMVLPMFLIADFLKLPGKVAKYNLDAQRQIAIEAQEHSNQS